MHRSTRPTPPLSIALALALALGGAAACSSPEAARARGAPPPEYVHFSGHAHGALYRPDPALFPSPSIGVITVHRTGNNLNHVSTRELPPRGFVVLGITTHAVNNEGAVEYDGRSNRDLKAAVDYLYDVVGLEKVVLLGHSGGGNTISLYQAVAENGMSVCQGPEKVVACQGDGTQVGRPADALMFMDSNVGTAINMLRRWNAAVVDETNPRRLDPSLDPFSEANGYNPDGCSRYSQDFQRRYFEGQARRVQRLTARAQAIQDAMDAGTHIPTDNDKFVAYRINARLYDLDNTIDAQTNQPRKLVKDNREIVTQIVPTVRPCGEPLGYSTPERDMRLERTRDMNVRTLLGIWSIQANNSMYDIDICSANGSTMCMVQHVRAPSLFTASQGNPYVVDNETMYELSGSRNKDYVVIEGATHGMDNCAACEGAPYSNVRRNFFDYLAAWMNGGFNPVEALP